MHKFRERPNLHKFREGFFWILCAFSIFKKNFRPWSANVDPQMPVRKSRSANARPQKSVRKCPSAKVGPQLPVRKSRSANARPQMSDPQMPVRNWPSANVVPQMTVLKCRNTLFSRYFCTYLMSFDFYY